MHACSVQPCIGAAVCCGTLMSEHYTPIPGVLAARDACPCDNLHALQAHNCIAWRHGVTWHGVWVQQTRTMMGPYTDIPGPEISAGSRMMSWFFDEYSKYNRFSPACVTGKVHPQLIFPPLRECSCKQPSEVVLPVVPRLQGLCDHVVASCCVLLMFSHMCSWCMQPVDLHGSHGREYATGRGAVLATRELLLHAHAGKIANKDFVIQVLFPTTNHTSCPCCCFLLPRVHVICLELMQRAQQIRCNVE